jgi:hypothetical protein
MEELTNTKAFYSSRTQRAQANKNAQFHIDAAVSAMKAARSLELSFAPNETVNVDYYDFVTEMLESLKRKMDNAKQNADGK